MKKFLSMSLVLILIAALLVGCGGKTYEDGTYTGEAEGHNGPVKVEVEVKDGKISSVEVVEHEESEGIAEPAIKDIPAAIVEKNSTDVDSVSGVTVTSDAIKEAVDNALK